MCAANNDDDDDANQRISFLSLRVPVCTPPGELDYTAHANLDRAACWGRANLLIARLSRICARILFARVEYPPRQLINSNAGAYRRSAIEVPLDQESTLFFFAIKILQFLSIDQNCMSLVSTRAPMSTKFGQLIKWERALSAGKRRNHARAKIRFWLSAAAAAASTMQLNV